MKRMCQHTTCTNDAMWTVHAHMKQDGFGCDAPLKTLACTPHLGAEVKELMDKNQNADGYLVKRL